MPTAYSALRHILVAALASLTLPASALDVTRTIDFDSGPSAGADAGLSAIAGTSIPGGLPDLTADGVGIGGSAALRLDGGDPLIGGSFSSSVFWEGFWAANDGSGSLPAGTPLSATTGSGVLMFSFDYKIESPNTLGGRDELHLLLTYGDENKSPDYRPLYNFSANAEVNGRIRYRTGPRTDFYDGPEYVDFTPAVNGWQRFNNMVQLFDVPLDGGGSEQGGSFLQVLNETQDTQLFFEAATDVTYGETGSPHAEFDTEKVAGIQLFGRNLQRDSVHLIDNITIGLIDTADVDTVTADIGTTNVRSDFTNDGTIDAADREYLIEQILATEVGDLNLDRVVDGADAAIAQANNGNNAAGYGDGDIDFDGDVDANDLAFFGLTPTLAGDYNGNGVVDAADYTVWADNFGSMVQLEADGNSNGVVDAADYTIWADNFGTSAALSQGLVPVPEPTSLALLSLTGLMLMTRRRIAAEA